jgi:hypothetical protein
LGVWGVFWGLVCLAHTSLCSVYKTSRKQHHPHPKIHTIILYIYIYTGGGYIRGYIGYRPFIDSPLDSIDIYIYMIDSMILWMKICLLFLFLFLFSWVLFGYMNRGISMGEKPGNVCNQGLGGFRGVNPGFTHFGGLRGYFGVWFI